MTKVVPTTETNIQIRVEESLVESVQKRKKDKGTYISRLYTVACKRFLRRSAASNASSKVTMCLGDITKRKMVSVRFDNELLWKIDNRVAELNSKQHGLSLNRTQWILWAVRQLLKKESAT